MNNNKKYNNFLGSNLKCQLSKYQTTNIKMTHSNVNKNNLCLVNNYQLGRKEDTFRETTLIKRIDLVHKERDLRIIIFNNIMPYLYYCFRKSVFLPSQPFNYIFNKTY
jgi:hypothetical protein